MNLPRNAPGYDPPMGSRRGLAVSLLLGVTGCLRPARIEEPVPKAVEAAAHAQTPLPKQEAGSSCPDRATQARAALQAGDKAKADTLFIEGLERCGMGYGFLEGAGMVAMSDGRTKVAVGRWRRAVLSPGASREAVAALIAVLPSLPPNLASEIRSLGTPQRAIYFPDFVLQSAWIERVICNGGPIVSSARDPNRPGAMVVECPPGQQHALHGIIERGPMTSPAETVPSGTPAAIAQVLPKVSGRFGIHTADELREALLEAAREPSQSANWLLGWVGDYPTSLKVARAVLVAQPDDLDATLTVGNLLTRLGNYDEAIRYFEKIDPSTLRLHDTRAEGLRPALIHVQLCLALRRAGRLGDALRECELGLKGGSPVQAPVAMAEVLYGMGRPADALHQIDSALAAARTIRKHDPAWLALRALILLDLDRREDARAALSAAGASETLFLREWLRGRARERKKVTPTEALRARDEGERYAASLMLSSCGHVYLDLGLPDQAASCFTSSERLTRGPADAARVQHEAETSPQRALERAKVAFNQSRDVNLSAAIAELSFGAGDHKAAVHWLSETVARDPRHPTASKLVPLVCAAIKDPECLRKFEPPSEIELP